MHPAFNASIDPDEVQRFAALAGRWWDRSGPMAPLHRFNPARIAFFRDQIMRQRGGDPRSVRPLAGAHVLDIGCGAGLLAEPLARLGATVTGVDPASDAIAVACAHAGENGLAISYRAGTAEELAAEGLRFDVVVASEVVEHVTDLGGFVRTVAALVHPGGVALFSTINRTPQSFALAIVGAEYVLRWLPAGTHRFDRFVRPSELSAACRAAGLKPAGETGFLYDPLTGTWRAGADMAVNYGFAARRG
jgi:2-polyprenyl-6-hydroxyphenyl methylase / 3-demethylubiquinone-9 3-methyltransferase